MLPVLLCCTLAGRVRLPTSSDELINQLRAWLNSFSPVLSLITPQSPFPASAGTRAHSPRMVPVPRMQLPEQPPGWLEGEKNLPGASTWLWACRKETPAADTQLWEISSFRTLQTTQPQLPRPHSQSGAEPLGSCFICHPAPSLTASSWAAVATLPRKQLHQG